MILLQTTTAQPQHRSLQSFRRMALSTMLALTAACTAFLPQIARADVPAQHSSQAPGYYRMMLGDLEVTALYDGYVPLSNTLLKGASDKDIRSLLARMFVPVTPNGVQTAVNAYLINTGRNLVLVDTGAAACFGPTLGAIGSNIQAAGYTMEQIDTVLLTHLHGDHACGLVAPDGTAAFANATVYASKAEAGFWLNKDTAAKAPEASRAFFKMAQDAIAPYTAAGKFKTFGSGDTLMSGITAVPLLGHTPGHGGYLFSSQGQELLVWGDVIHSHAVQFLHPEVSIEFDSDQKQAIATRKKVLARAAQEKLWIAGAHLPFPGIGHVRANQKGYAWVPVEYSPLPAKQ